LKHLGRARVRRGVRPCLLALLLLTACGGAAPAPAAPPSTRDGAVEGETVELRVRLPTALRTYARDQSITIRDLGGHHVRLASRSVLQVRENTPGADRVLRYQTHGPLQYHLDGEPQPTTGALDGLERHQIRTLVDHRNHLLEGPELTGDARSRQLSAAVLALSRLLEPYYPDAPVAVGARWVEPPTVWDTPPLGLAQIEIERAFTLDAIEGEGAERTARIGWDVRLTVRPFEIGSVTVDGHGRIEGFSVVSLADGVEGHAALDLTFEAGPAGASDVIPLVEIDAKIRDHVRLATETGPSDLIQSVPPVDPRS